MTTQLLFSDMLYTYHALNLKERNVVPGLMKTVKEYFTSLHNVIRGERLNFTLNMIHSEWFLVPPQSRVSE